METQAFSILTHLWLSFAPGLTPSNEIRDAPAYLRPVTSEPTDHDSTCELSRSPSPDMSDILCYKLRKKKNKKVNPQQSPQSPTSPPPCHPVIPKPRYGSEKVANFKAPQSQTSISSPKSSVLMPPLSPGRVRVLKNVSLTASTVSSVYQYTVSSSSISPSPTTQPSTATNSNSPNHCFSIRKLFGLWLFQT